MMKSHIRARLCVGAGVSALLSLSVSVSAVHAASAGAPESATISDVVVTAQRRSESAQNVPIAMTTQTAASLENAGVQTYADIGRLTPGLMFQATGASQVPFLRGVGASTTAAGAEAGVALYVDDVYFPASQAATLSLNNVDSVTVLRGPQGTLFGRNATGGVVQIATRRPGQTPRFDLTVGYGNHDTKEGTFYVSAPVTDKIAFDVAGYIRNEDGGWGKNIFTGDKAFRGYDRALRTRWEIEVAPQSQVTVTGWYFKNKTQGGFATTRLGPGELGQNERYAGGVVGTEGFYDIDLNSWSGATTEVYGASAKLVQGLGFAELRSITAYNHMSSVGYVDFDFTRAFVSYVRIPPTDQTYSQEFQLASKDDPGARLSWLTGVYLYRDSSFYDHEATILPGVLTQITNTKQNTNSWSVFAQGDYKLTDKTTLTLGARYNSDRRQYVGSLSTTLASGISTFQPSSGTKTFPGSTFKAELEHHFTDDVMGYVGYTTGFKSGFFGTQTIQTVPGQPSVGLPVNPEKVKSFEGGFKSVLLDRKVRLNVSAFHYDYKDLQVNAFINSTTRVTINAKAAKIYGVDLDGEWRATDQLYFTLAAELLHARYTDYKNAPIFTPRTVAPWGSSAVVGDASGSHINYAPDVTATLGANYTVPLAYGDLSFNGTAAYNGGFYFAATVNRLHQPSFTLLSGNVKWTAPHGRYDISLWGRNLSDEKVFASINPTTGGDAAEPAEPRTFGVKVGLHY